MYQRYAKQKLMAALTDTPVVLLAGPRQCGKTTLVKQLQCPDQTYITLDDLNQLQLAKADPIGFIRGLRARHIIIDEIQRAPELFLPIKQAVDENRLPGRYILTGSANAMMLPNVADSLAGRMEVIHLWPLAACEIDHHDTSFLAKILAGQVPTSKKTRIREELIIRVLSGGFPEALLRKNDSRRISWFQQYMQSMIQKDLQSLGHIDHIDTMNKLIHSFANQTGNLMNFSKVGSQLGLSRQTVMRYAQLLEQLFIFQPLPAWHRNDNKRLIKTSKAHLTDSGLLSALRRMNHQKINREPHAFGALLENYVLGELRRLASWYDEPLYFSHYRDKDKKEVDIVIENLAGQVIGIEVKAGATLHPQDYHGLQRLKNAAGPQFLLGLVLYDGDHTNAIGENIFSTPLASLWV